MKKCCVCLIDSERLIMDGNCTEGVCSTCFTEINKVGKCPNCRVEFPWKTPTVDEDEDDDEVYGDEVDNRCIICFKANFPHYSMMLYTGRPYECRGGVCSKCIEIYNFDNFRKHVSNFGAGLPECTHCQARDSPNGYMAVYIPVNVAETNEHLDFTPTIQNAVLYLCGNCYVQPVAELDNYRSYWTNGVLREVKIRDAVIDIEQ